LDSTQDGIADFGVNEIYITRAQIIALVDSDQIAAKLLVRLPYQTEPVHTHSTIADCCGKEETIRCEWGELYL